MISDTPRTQARVRYMIDNNISPEGLEHWANGLERELNTANVEIEEKRKDIVYLATEKAKLEDRIKRLEEDGDEAICPIEYATRVRIWTKAKEAKP